MTKPTTTPHVPTLFYAWQSDLPVSINRYFIRDALKKAVGQLSKSNPNDPSLKVDEATRDEPGSPMIAEVILGKIDRCEAFVGDISVINANAGDTRPVPNPNVSFETGWAAARVGWERTILLFNTSTGKIEIGVPFDLRGRRILQYSLVEGASKAETDKASAGLQRDLVAALKSSLASPPPLRRTEKRSRVNTLSPAQQRDRDRALLNRVLGAIDSEWIGRYTDALQDARILHGADLRYFAFNDITRAATFRLFDKSTERRIVAFAASWDIVYELTEFGDAHPNEPFVRFRPQSYGRSNAEAGRLRGKLMEAASQMVAKYATLLARVHKAFPEFDISETDKQARQRLGT